MSVICFSVPLDVAGVFDTALEDAGVSFPNSEFPVGGSEVPATGACTAGTGVMVVTLPAQEATGIFFDSCIPGSQCLYHAAPVIVASSATISTASRNAPARNPGVKFPRARNDRLRFGSET